MLPVIYTTYGVAMGHRPEALAASGGLQPAGVGESRERPVSPGVARVARWRVILGWLRRERWSEARRRACPDDARVLPASR